jgi:hypothetical protein
MRRLAAIPTWISILVALPLISLHAQLIRNADFSEGEKHWGLWGQGDLRTEFHGLTPDAGSNFLRLWSISGWYQSFPVHKGEKIKVSARVATVENDALHGDAYGALTLEWRDDSEGEDKEVGTAKTITFSAERAGKKRIKTDEWVTLELPVRRVPSRATHGRVLCTVFTEGGDKGGGCALFDEITVELIK